jgi:glycosyltransferase involved in cell wall biosynthesis
MVAGPSTEDLEVSLMPTLDIVVPAHNEQERIDRTLRAYRTGLTDPSVRFLVALDGCEDGTAAIVAAHRSQDRRVHLLDFPKLGKGGVLMEAFRRADADWVAFVDADCATPPAELQRLVATAEQAGADGAIASRRHPASFTPGPRHSRSRALTSLGFATVMRGLFGLPYRDTQCGAKVVSREVVQRAVPLLSSRDFLFDVDLLLVASRLGFTVLEVPTVWVDQAGSKVRAGRDAARMLASALRLRLHHAVMPAPKRSVQAPPPAGALQRERGEAVPARRPRRRHTTAVLVAMERA